MDDNERNQRKNEVNSLVDKERKGKSKVEEEDFGNGGFIHKKMRLNSDFNLLEKREIDLVVSQSIGGSTSVVKCPSSSACRSMRLWGVDITVPSEKPCNDPTRDDGSLTVTRVSPDPPELPETLIDIQYDNLPREAGIENQNNALIDIQYDFFPREAGIENQNNALIDIQHDIVPQVGVENQNDARGVVAGQLVNQPQGQANANVGWPITKNLSRSDVMLQQNRLLIKSETVHHIMDHLTVQSREYVQVGNGIDVNVYDQDTNQAYHLRFNKFPSTQAHVLNGQWYNDFVVRRHLKQRDEIGLRWDVDNNILVFSVLNRAPGLAEESEESVHVTRSI